MELTHVKLFKYLFFLPLSEMLLKDKIVMEHKLQNTSDAWRLTLTMSLNRLGIRTLAPTVKLIMRFQDEPSVL